MLSALASVGRPPGASLADKHGPEDNIRVILLVESPDLLGEVMRRVELSAPDVDACVEGVKRALSIERSNGLVVEVYDELFKRFVQLDSMDQLVGGKGRLKLSHFGNPDADADFDPGEEILKERFRELILRARSPDNFEMGKAIAELNQLRQMQGLTKSDMTGDTLKGAFVQLLLSFVDDVNRDIRRLAAKQARVTVLQGGTTEYFFHRGGLNQLSVAIRECQDPYVGKDLEEILSILGLLGPEFTLENGLPLLKMRKTLPVDDLDLHPIVACLHQSDRDDVDVSLQLWATESVRRLAGNEYLHGLLLRAGLVDALLTVLKSVHLTQPASNSRSVLAGEDARIAVTRCLETLVLILNNSTLYSRYMDQPIADIGLEKDHPDALVNPVVVHGSGTKQSVRHAAFAGDDVDRGDTVLVEDDGTGTSIVKFKDVVYCVKWIVGPPPAPVTHLRVTYVELHPDSHAPLTSGKVQLQSREDGTKWELENPDQVDSGTWVFRKGNNVGASILDCSIKADENKQDRLSAIENTLLAGLNFKSVDLGHDGAPDRVDPSEFASSGRQADDKFSSDPRAMWFTMDVGVNMVCSRFRICNPGSGISNSVKGPWVRDIALLVSTETKVPKGRAAPADETFNLVAVASFQHHTTWEAWSEQINFPGGPVKGRFWKFHVLNNAGDDITYLRRIDLYDVGTSFHSDIVERHGHKMLDTLIKCFPHPHNQPADDKGKFIDQIVKGLTHFPDGSVALFSPALSQICVRLYQGGQDEGGMVLKMNGQMKTRLSHSVSASMMRVIVELPSNRKNFLARSKDSGGLVSLLFELAMDGYVEADTALSMLAGVFPSYPPMDHGQPIDSVLFHITHPGKCGYMNGTTHKQLEGAEINRMGVNGMLASVEGPQPNVLQDDVCGRICIICFSHFTHARKKINFSGDRFETVRSWVNDAEQKGAAAFILCPASVYGLGGGEAVFSNSAGPVSVQKDRGEFKVRVGNVLYAVRWFPDFGPPAQDIHGMQVKCAGDVVKVGGEVSLTRGRSVYKFHNVSVAVEPTFVEPLSYSTPIIWTSTETVESLLEYKETGKRTALTILGAATVQKMDEPTMDFLLHTCKVDYTSKTALDWFGFSALPPSRLADVMRRQLLALKMLTLSCRSWQNSDSLVVKKDLVGVASRLVDWHHSNTDFKDCLVVLFSNLAQSYFVPRTVKPEYLEKFTALAFQEFSDSSDQVTELDQLFCLSLRSQVRYDCFRVVSRLLWNVQNRFLFHDSSKKGTQHWVNRTLDVATLGAESDSPDDHFEEEQLALVALQNYTSGIAMDVGLVGTDDNQLSLCRASISSSIEIEDGMNISTWNIKTGDCSTQKGPPAGEGPPIREWLCQFGLLVVFTENAWDTHTRDALGDRLHDFVSDGGSVLLFGPATFNLGGRWERSDCGPLVSPAMMPDQWTGADKTTAAIRPKLPAFMNMHKDTGALVTFEGENRVVFQSKIFEVNWIGQPVAMRPGSKFLLESVVDKVGGKVSLDNGAKFENPANMLFSSSHRDSPVTLLFDHEDNMIKVRFKKFLYTVKWNKPFSDGEMAKWKHKSRKKDVFAVSSVVNKLGGAVILEGGYEFQNPESNQNTDEGTHDMLFDDTYGAHDADWFNNTNNMMAFDSRVQLRADSIPMLLSDNKVPLVGYQRCGDGEVISFNFLPFLSKAHIQDFIVVDSAMTRILNRCLLLLAMADITDKHKELFWKETQYRFSPQNFLRIALLKLMSAPKPQIDEDAEKEKPKPCIVEALLHSIRCTPIELTKSMPGKTSAHLGARASARRVTTTHLCLNLSFIGDKERNSNVAHEDMTLIKDDDCAPILKHLRDLLRMYAMKEWVDGKEIDTSVVRTCFLALQLCKPNLFFGSTDSHNLGGAGYGKPSKGMELVVSDSETLMGALFQASQDSDRRTKLSALRILYHMTDHEPGDPDFLGTDDDRELTKGQRRIIKGLKFLMKNAIFKPGDIVFARSYAGHLARGCLSTFFLKAKHVKDNRTDGKSQHEFTSLFKTGGERAQARWKALRDIVASTRRLSVITSLSKRKVVAEVEDEFAESAPLQEEAESSRQSQQKSINRDAEAKQVFARTSRAVDASLLNATYVCRADVELIKEMKSIITENAAVDFDELNYEWLAKSFGTMAMQAKNIPVLIKEGVLEILAIFTQPRYSERVRSQAKSALKIMAYKHAVQQQVEEHEIQVVLDKARSPDSHTQLWAARSLVILAHNNENKMNIIERQGVRPLNYLKQHAEKEKRGENTDESETLKFQVELALKILSFGANASFHHSKEDAAGDAASDHPIPAITDKQMLYFIQGAQEPIKETQVWAAKALSQLTTNVSNVEVLVGLSHKYSLKPIGLGLQALYDLLQIEESRPWAIRALFNIGTTPQDREMRDKTCRVVCKALTPGGPDAKSVFIKDFFVNDANSISLLSCTQPNITGPTGLMQNPAFIRTEAAAATLSLATVDDDGTMVDAFNETILLTIINKQFGADDHIRRKAMLCLWNTLCSQSDENDSEESKKKFQDEKKKKLLDLMSHPVTDNSSGLSIVAQCIDPSEALESGTMSPKTITDFAVDITWLCSKLGREERGSKLGDEMERLVTACVDEDRVIENLTNFYLNAQQTLEVESAGSTEASARAPTLKLKAAMTVANFALNKKNVEEIVAEQGIICIINLVFDRDPTMQEIGLTSMGYLASDPQTHPDISANLMRIKSFSKQVMKDKHTGHADSTGTALWGACVKILFNVLKGMGGSVVAADGFLEAIKEFACPTYLDRRVTGEIDSDKCEWIIRQLIELFRDDHRYLRDLELKVRAELVEFLLQMIPVLGEKRSVHIYQCLLTMCTMNRAPCAENQELIRNCMFNAGLSFQISSTSQSFSFKCCEIDELKFPHMRINSVVFSTYDINADVSVVADIDGRYQVVFNHVTYPVLWLGGAPSSPPDDLKITSVQESNNDSIVELSNSLRFENPKDDKFEKLQIGFDGGDVWSDYVAVSDQKGNKDIGGRRNLDAEDDEKAAASATFEMYLQCLAALCIGQRPRSAIFSETDVDSTVFVCGNRIRFEGCSYTVEWLSSRRAKVDRESDSPWTVVSVSAAAVSLKRKYDDSGHVVQFKNSEPLTDAQRDIQDRVPYSVLTKVLQKEPQECPEAGGVGLSLFATFANLYNTGFVHRTSHGASDYQIQHLNRQLTFVHAGGGHDMVGIEREVVVMEQIEKFVERLMKSSNQKWPQCLHSQQWQQCLAAIFALARKLLSAAFISKRVHEFEKHIIDFLNAARAQDLQNRTSHRTDVDLEEAKLHSFGILSVISLHNRAERISETESILEHLLQDPASYEKPHELWPRIEEQIGDKHPFSFVQFAPTSSAFYVSPLDMWISDCVADVEVRALVKLDKGDAKEERVKSKQGHCTENRFQPFFEDHWLGVQHSLARHGHEFLFLLAHDVDDFASWLRTSVDETPFLREATRNGRPIELTVRNDGCIHLVDGPADLWVPVVWTEFDLTSTKEKIEDCVLEVNTVANTVGGNVTVSTSSLSNGQADFENPTLKSIFEASLKDIDLRHTQDRRVDLSGVCERQLAPARFSVHYGEHEKQQSASFFGLQRLYSDSNVQSGPRAGGRIANLESRIGSQSHNAQHHHEKIVKHLLAKFRDGITVSKSDHDVAIELKLIDMLAQLVEGTLEEEVLEFKQWLQEKRQTNRQTDIKARQLHRFEQDMRGYQESSSDCGAIELVLTVLSHVSSSPADFLPELKLAGGRLGCALLRGGNTQVQNKFITVALRRLNGASKATMNTLRPTFVSEIINSFNNSVNPAIFCVTPKTDTLSGMADGAHGNVVARPEDTRLVLQHATNLLHIMEMMCVNQKKAAQDCFGKHDPHCSLQNPVHLLRGRESHGSLLQIVCGFMDAVQRRCEDVDLKSFVSLATMVEIVPQLLQLERLDDMMVDDIPQQDLQTDEYAQLLEALKDRVGEEDDLRAAEQRLEQQRLLLQMTTGLCRFLKEAVSGGNSNNQTQILQDDVLADIQKCLQTTFELHKNLKGWLDKIHKLMHNPKFTKVATKQQLNALVDLLKRRDDDLEMISTLELELVRCVCLTVRSAESTAGRHEEVEEKLYVPLQNFGFVVSEPEVQKHVKSPMEKSLLGKLKLYFNDVGVAMPSADHSEGESSNASFFNLILHDVKNTCSYLTKQTDSSGSATGIASVLAKKHQDLRIDLFVAYFELVVDMVAKDSSVATDFQKWKDHLDDVPDVAIEDTETTASHEEASAAHLEAGAAQSSWWQSLTTFVTPTVTQTTRMRATVKLRKFVKTIEVVYLKKKNKVTFVVPFTAMDTFQGGDAHIKKMELVTKSNENNDRARLKTFVTLSMQPDGVVGVMKHQADMQTDQPGLKMLAELNAEFDTWKTNCAFAINALLVAYARPSMVPQSKYILDEGEMLGLSVWWIINILAMLHVFLALLSYIAFLADNAQPIFDSALEQLRATQNKPMDDEDTGFNFLDVWTQASALMTRWSFLVSTFYLMLSVVGFLVDHFYISFCVVLIALMSAQFKQLQEAIGDEKKLTSLAATFGLGIALIYMYASMGLMFFQDMYEFDPGSVPFTTVLASVLSHLDYGFRSAPVWKSDFGYDAVSPLAMSVRFLFALSYNFIVILVFTAIISGIVIDAFSVQREKEAIVDHDMLRRCFVCGAERENLEDQEVDFQSHINTTHNMWSFLLYFARLDMINPSRRTTIEREIYLKLNKKEAVLGQEPDPDVTFFPLSRDTLMMLPKV